MTDTVFHTASTPGRSPVKAGPVDSKQTQDNIRDVEAPYLDYEKSEGELFIVGHFELSDGWRDNAPLAEAVKGIHTYISNEIKKGKIANDIGAVKTLLKKVLKASDTKDESRTEVKLAQTLAYLEYQEANEEITEKAEKEAKKTFSDRPDIEHTKDSRPDLQKFDSKKGGKND